MEEKKERSYAKESAKSTPSGIRFDLEKLAFIQKRENVPTKQKVVDFLLNKYWWENKVPVVSAKEALPLILNESAGKDAPLSFDNLKEQTNPFSVDYYAEMDKAESLEELEAVGRRVKASGMSFREQKMFHDYGQMIAKKKFIE